MSKALLSTALASLLVAAASSQASPDDKRFYGMAPLWPFGGGPGAAALARLDDDGDGRVAVEEARRVLRAQLRRHDRDGDGALDRDEYEGFWLERMRPMVARSFQLWDEDADGRVTDGELERRIRMLFWRFDHNGDGVITPGEWRRRLHEYDEDDD